MSDSPDNSKIVIKPLWQLALACTIFSLFLLLMGSFLVWSLFTVENFPLFPGLVSFPISILGLLCLFNFLGFFGGSDKFDLIIDSEGFKHPGKHDKFRWAEVKNFRLSSIKGNAYIRFETDTRKNLAIYFVLFPYSAEQILPVLINRQKHYLQGDPLIPFESIPKRQYWHCFMFYAGIMALGLLCVWVPEFSKQAILPESQLKLSNLSNTQVYNINISGDYLGNRTYNQLGDLGANKSQEYKLEGIKSSTLNLRYYQDNQEYCRVLKREHCMWKSDTIIFKPKGQLGIKINPDKYCRRDEAYALDCYK